jgi:hypothetical protein
MTPDECVRIRVTGLHDNASKIFDGKYELKYSL